jgi:hypothetical protein
MPQQKKTRLPATNSTEILPAEILQHIFSFLGNRGASDRAVVCSFWAQQQREVITTIDFSNTNITPEYLQQILPHLLECFPRLQNLNLSNTPIAHVFELLEEHPDNPNHRCADGMDMPEPFQFRQDRLNRAQDLVNFFAAIIIRNSSITIQGIPGCAEQINAAIQSMKNIMQAPALP